MEGPFLAVKRSITNDNIKSEAIQWTIKYFVSKQDAANWLVDQIEESYLAPESKERQAVFNFFCQCEPGEAFFEWEWKRRGNNRQYRILPLQDGQVQFYQYVKQFYKLKDGEIKKCKIQ